jgi:hypothetical protein
MFCPASKYINASKHGIYTQIHGKLKAQNHGDLAVLRVFPKFQAYIPPLVLEKPHFGPRP